MSQLEDVKYGWDFMSKALGADTAGRSAFSDYMSNLSQNNAINEQNLHIQQINDAIQKLSDDINNHAYKNLGIEQFKGYVAEEWHTDTFNIDAIEKGSEHRAWTLHSTERGSVDIDTNFGKQYSSKYMATPEKTAAAQAAFDRDAGLPEYHGQERLIAYEQVDVAKKWAHRRAGKNIESRPDVSQSYMETEEHLVGKISDGEGVESKEFSIKESKQIAREAKKGEFDPEKYGYKKDALLDEVRIEYVNQAVKAGLTAAAISAITQIVPELYKAIDYLIKHGEIDVAGLKKAGKTVITASGEAFLRGSIAYGVEMAIQEGLLGEALKQLNPSVVGVAVTVILGTIKNSIMVAAGRMTAKEMGMKFADTIVVSSGYLVSMKIGGAIAQALCPQLPVVGYAIGSLLGCSVAVVYGIGKRKLISFCVDTGFTCFGLVEQNYELPEEALKNMGVHFIPVPKTEVQRTTIDKTSTDVQIHTSTYETIDITVLKRGIIGVNRIGYVMA